MTFIWSVSFQSIKQEGSALLNLIVLQEDLSNLVDVCFWHPLVSIGHHFGQVYSCLSVYGHDLSQDFYEICNITSLLAIRHDFVQLAGFD